MTLRWSARAASLVSLGVLLLFLTGDDGLLGVENWAKVRPAEWPALLLFPFGVMIGLAVAWWREALGAATAVLSLTAFYAYWVVLTGRVPGGPWFLAFASPAALFFGSWLARGRRSDPLAA
jgi:hypothetical protein